ncbi:hypothetical protein I547_2248 [Mycobacterium kansasii 824]|nr:hypothetical protein I547_2248 [Mycobacterium kansasii 824]
MDRQLGRGIGRVGFDGTTPRNRHGAGLTGRGAGGGVGAGGRADDGAAGAGLLDPRPGAPGLPGVDNRVVGGSLGWLALIGICLVPALDGPL